MICVLMSTYNGERYLEEQIESIMSQQDVELNLFVRDDGSSDSTLGILKKWSEKINWYVGINVGPARSFFDLMMKAPNADYYAFSDQDDVWNTDKLSSAMTFLKNVSRPALYFSQTSLVDSHLNPIDTPKISPSCNFEESLMCNYATGCTFVFNRSLMELIKTYDPKFLPMHDYWVYHLCLAIGGSVFFDPISHIKYRQHSRNVIGLSKGAYVEMKRRFNRTIHHECERSQTVKELYNGYKDMIVPDLLPLIRNIVNYHFSFKSKLAILFNPKLRSPNFLKTLSMRVAIILNTF